jgi:ribonuclease HI
VAKAKGSGADERVKAIVSAILDLEPTDRRRLFALLAEHGLLPDQSASPTGTAKQMEMLSSTPRRARRPDYVLVFDGGSKGNPGLGYGSYAIIRTQDGAQRLKRLVFGDGMTNNEAEYDALISALGDLLQRIEKAGKQPQDFALEVRGDSALVINQIQGKWKAREPRMRERRNRCVQLLGRFGGVSLKAHPREESVRILGH